MVGSALIIVLLLMIFLLPAHFQVREISLELPPEASLRALLQVDNAPVRVSYITKPTQRSPIGLLGHNLRRALTSSTTAWRGLLERQQKPSSASFVASVA